jgi:hypothetical protein
VNDALIGLLGGRVKAHRFDGTHVSGWVREPSGTDWISIKQLDASVRASGGKDAKLPGFAVVPLLLCDEGGKQVFPDYEEGMNYVRSLRSDALAELVNFTLKLSGLATLSVEEAEKKYSASPTSDSPSASP